jgi:hypothetical protein
MQKSRQFSIGAFHQKKNVFLRIGNFPKKKPVLRQYRPPTNRIAAKWRLLCGNAPITGLKPV